MSAAGVPVPGGGCAPRPEAMWSLGPCVPEGLGVPVGSGPVGSGPLHSGPTGSANSWP